MTFSTNEPQADLLFVLATLKNHRRVETALQPSAAAGRANQMCSHDFMFVMEVVGGKVGDLAVALNL